MTPHSHNRRPLIAAATLLGIGLGGFVDGILFHQLLQFHNMLSGADYYPKTGLPAGDNRREHGDQHVLGRAVSCPDVDDDRAGLAMLWRAGQSQKFRGLLKRFSADFPSGGDFSIWSKASSTITFFTSIT